MDPQAIAYDLLRHVVSNRTYEARFTELNDDLRGWISTGGFKPTLPQVDIDLIVEKAPDLKNCFLVLDTP